MLRIVKQVQTMRMYLTAASRHLGTIEVFGIPVYGVQTVGPSTALSAAVLCRLAITHATKLKIEPSKVRDSENDKWEYNCMDNA